ncbi:hypothetical protein Misp06_00739 [Microbulbifer sp. NBRC 101763]|uniref:hypothetical protein n=1 Tax=Microbulbifer sp. NBRC 101763 TaxID=1113820 RepID=UPI0030B3CE04
MRLPILLMLVIYSSGLIAETFKEKAVSKISAYYCSGNQNFLYCIKPEILSDLQDCVTYFVKNTTKCSSKYLDLGMSLSDEEQMNITMEFGQCSLRELMKAEDIKESDFDECFSRNYDESKRSPVLDR